MDKTKKSRMKTFNISDFTITIVPYTDRFLFIIYNSIPGIGTIIDVQNNEGNVEIEKLLGLENDYLNLLAINLSKLFNNSSLTFIFSFNPNIFKSIEEIKEFIKQINEELNKKN